MPPRGGRQPRPRPESWPGADPAAGPSPVGRASQGAPLPTSALPSLEPQQARRVHARTVCPLVPACLLSARHVRLVPAAARVETPPLFDVRAASRRADGAHFIHPSVHGPGDTWVVPAFGRRDRRRCAKICSRPCTHRRSVRAMGRFRVYCFEGPATCLPQQLPRFPFPPATPESRSRSASRPARTPSVPGLAIPAGTEETPVVVVSCVLSVAKDVEHLSVCSSPTILIYLFTVMCIFLSGRRPRVCRNGANIFVTW